MLQETGCHKIVFQPVASSLVVAVGSSMAERGSPIELVPLPDFDVAYPFLEGKVADAIQPYPTTTALAGPNNVVLYLHSSGSTGFPKPILQTNRIMLQWACTRP